MNKKKLRGISPIIGNRIGDKIMKEKLNEQIRKFYDLKRKLDLFISINKSESNPSVILEARSLSKILSLKISNMFLVKHFVDKLYIIERDNKVKYPKYKFSKKYIKHLDKELVYIKNEIERIKNDR